MTESQLTEMIHKTIPGCTSAAKTGAYAGWEVFRCLCEGTECAVSCFCAQDEDGDPEFNRTLLARYASLGGNTLRPDNIQLCVNPDGLGYTVLARTEMYTPLGSDLPGDPESVIRMGKELCRALLFAEEKGVLLRCVSPEQLCTAADGTLRLGLPLLRRCGISPFSAPEVNAGAAFDRTAAVWSLGMLLWFCLNGQSLPAGWPDAANPDAPLPEPLHSDGNLIKILRKACALNPEARYKSAASMLRDLETVEQLIAAAVAAAAAAASAQVPPAKKAKAEKAEKPKQPKQKETPVKSAKAEQKEPAAKKAPVRREKKFLVGGILLLLLAMLLNAGVFAAFSVLSTHEFSLPADDGEREDIADDENDENEDGDDGKEPENGTKELSGGKDTKETGKELGTSTGANTEKSDGKDTELQEVTVRSLTVKRYPNKTEYYVGEKFSPAGVQLEVRYSNGTSEVIDSGFTCTQPTFAAAGSYTVTFTYEGKTVSITVKAAEPTVTSLTIRSLPKKTVYQIGELLDTEGLTLTETYANGTEKIITSGFTFSPTAFTSAGTHTVQVRYGAKSVSFTVTVQNAALRSLSVQTMPNKLQYTVGESLDTAGLALRCEYSDGSSNTVTEGFICTPTVLNTAGTQTVTVTYGGLNTNFTVTVKEAAVTATKLEIQSLPKKTVYTAGESLDTAGLVLKITYSSGLIKEISSGFTCTPDKLTSAGTQTVTVSCEGLSTSFTVTVNAAAVTVTKIEIQSKPKKLSYTVGESLDRTGLALKVTYSDGSVKTVTSGYTYSPSKLTKAGTQTITVDYSGKRTTFTVTVKEAKTLTSLKIKTMPTKTVYSAGEKLNTAGLTLTASYSDGTSATVTSGFTCSPTALNTVGTQKITVSYGGKSVTFNVTVAKKAETVLPNASRRTEVISYETDNDIRDMTVYRKDPFEKEGEMTTGYYSKFDGKYVFHISGTPAKGDHKLKIAPEGLEDWKVSTSKYLLEYELYFKQYRKGCTLWHIASPVINGVQCTSPAYVRSDTDGNLFVQSVNGKSKKIAEKTWCKVSVLVDLENGSCSVFVDGTFLDQTALGKTLGDSAGSHSLTMWVPKFTGDKLSNNELDFYIATIKIYNIKDD